MKRCALALALGTSVHGGDLIDFETLPDGTPTVDLQEIGLEYAEFGVTFTMINAAGDVIGTPNIAKVGAPQTAFQTCLGADTPLDGQGVGDTFLTDNTSIGISGRLLITYASPVAQAAGVILDTDCRNGGNPPCEQWTITAHDSKGATVDTFVVDGPIGPPGPPCNDPNGPGDGLAAGWFFDRAEADISSVIIEYTGAATTVGLAFDNFTPSSIPPLSVTAWESDRDICYGQVVTLTSEVIGGIPPFDLEWQQEVAPETWEAIATGPTADVTPFTDATYRFVVEDAAGTVVETDPFDVGVTDVLFEISQESAPGAGDFGENVLGTILPYETTDTAADFYGWAAGGTPYSGPEPPTTNARSHLFMVTGADGLALYTVHDSPGGAGGGRAETEIDFDCETATYFVQDDATDSGDVFQELEDGGLFRMRGVWVAGQTDGAAIGVLDCEWTATMMFSDLFSGDPTFNGLDSWVAYSKDGSELPLVLEEDRRVRIAAIIGCPWDLDGDGTVAVTDLVDVIVAWGPCGEEACPADFDCSGAVDVADLVEVIINWGPCD